jgi:REP element-mobilizing transposase RayT
MKKDRSAGVPPAMNGGQDVRPFMDSSPPFLGEGAFLNPFDEIEMREHRLPHWQQGEVLYFVTWRLADSLPREKLAQWADEKRAWLRGHPQPWDKAEAQEYHARFCDAIDHWLDAGEGSCLLQDPANRAIVDNALRHFDGQKVDLAAFVVMPNHVHILFRLRPGQKLEDVIHSWKSFTAKGLNRRLGRNGPLWQEDYWDRMIRNPRHLQACLGYIRDNPSKARLPDGAYTLFEGSARVGLVMNGGQDARPPVPPAVAGGQDVT